MIFKLNPKHYHVIDGIKKVDKVQFRGKYFEDGEWLSTIFYFDAGGMFQTDDENIAKQLKKSRFCKEVVEEKQTIMDKVKGAIR